MRTKQILTAVITPLVVLAPLAVFAQLSPAPVSPLPTTFSDLTAFFTAIRTIANWLFAFLLVIGVIYLLVGAFQYMGAGGDAEKQGTARSRIVYGLVGIAIGTLALALVNIVTRFFGGGGLPTT